jgi:hypothetical protein
MIGAENMIVAGSLINGAITRWNKNLIRLCLAVTRPNWSTRLEHAIPRVARSFNRNIPDPPNRTALMRE